MTKIPQRCVHWSLSHHKMKWSRWSLWKFSNQTCLRSLNSPVTQGLKSPRDVCTEAYHTVIWVGQIESHFMPWPSKSCMEIWNKFGSIITWNHFEIPFENSRMALGKHLLFEALSSGKLGMGASCFWDVDIQGEITSWSSISCTLPHLLPVFQSVVWCPLWKTTSDLS